MSEQVADFHRIDARLRLSGTITARTALRIGSGGAGDLDAADLPVIKDGDGFPFIPGGSLKGALRSTIEALVRAAERRDVGLWSCDPLRDEKDGACGHHDSGKRQDVKVEEHCAVCRLLGSHVVASHTRLSDAMARASIEDRHGRHAPIEIRDGVTIDRDQRTVYRSQKYDFEVIAPGTEFNLEVFVENPKPWLMGLLMIGFDQIGEGFTALGGFTSRGLGRVEIAWSKMTRVTARALLEGREPEQFTGETMMTEITQWRRALAERAQGGR